MSEYNGIDNIEMNTQRQQQQLVNDTLPSVLAAWTARASEIQSVLEGETDANVIRSTLNSAALERLVPPPDGAGQIARLRFEGKARAIRSAILAPLYTSLLP